MDREVATTDRRIEVLKMELQKRTSGIDVENKLDWFPGRKSQLNEYLLGRRGGGGVRCLKRGLKSLLSSSV